MTEEWRAVLDGNYEVSNLGQVRRATLGRRTYAGRLMTPVLQKIGYYMVAPTVSGKNKQTYIHALVAEAFIGPRPEGYSVNHIDGVKTNNAATNLEYVTHAENMQHAARTGLTKVGEQHGGARLTDVQVRQIKADRAKGLSYPALARLHNTAISHVWQIVNGNARRSA